MPNFAIAVSVNESNIIDLTNIEREKNNLSILHENPLLKKAAEQKAQDIINSGMFSHSINNNSFSKWIKDVNYEYSFIGENLALDFLSSEGAIKAWLDSPTHKENLLNERFEEIGVAVLEGEFENSNTILVVQIFGTPTIKFDKVATKQNRREETLLVKLENGNIVNNEANMLMTKTISNDSKTTLSLTSSSHPLTSNSKTGKIYSILFAIIMSSLVVSIMFPKGIKIKKPQIRAFKKHLLKKFILKKDTKSHP